MREKSTIKVAQRKIYADNAEENSRGDTENPEKYSRGDAENAEKGREKTLLLSYTLLLSHTHKKKEPGSYTQALTMKIYYPLFKNLTIRF